MIPTLSPRQQQILDLLVAGKRRKQIAANLGISINTLSVHITRLFIKLHVQNRTEAAILGWRAQNGGSHAD